MPDPSSFDTDPGRSAAFAGGLFDTDPGRPAAFPDQGRSSGFGAEREQPAPLVPDASRLRPTLPDQGQSGDSGWGAVAPGTGPEQTRPAAYSPDPGPASPGGFGPETGALGAFRPEQPARSGGYEPDLRAAQPRPDVTSEQSRPFDPGPAVPPRVEAAAATPVDTEPPASAPPRPPAFEPARREPSFDDQPRYEEPAQYQEPTQYREPARSEASAYQEQAPYSEAVRSDAPAYQEQAPYQEPGRSEASAYQEQPSYSGHSDSPGYPEHDEPGEAEWPETRTGPELAAEPLMGLGLGARLAALQAQSGGFSVITPDDAVEDVPSGTIRGIWDPKVPPVPAEPDEDFDYRPYPESGSPSPQNNDGSVTGATAPPHDEPGPEPEFHAQPETQPEPAPPPPPPPPAEPEPVSWDYSKYQPANSTEEELLEATRSNTSNQMLSTLLLAKVLIPGYAADPAHWPVEEIKGNRYLVAFTSMQRLTAHYEATLPEPEPVRFTTVIAKWPTEEIGFALNPGTPMGRLLGGSEVRGLARSAAEFGLIDADSLVAVADAEEASALTQAIPEPTTPTATASDQPQLMQRTISAAQVSMYLDRGYDRVCGFVHRAGELAHLSKPADLYRALGLAYPESPFSLDDTEVYVLRWPAHLLGLYRIPYGGQTEEAMHLMQGWMIERAPYRGNGFAPGDSTDVVAEFKIDSTRLPHGAQLWRLNSDGIETLVALFDADSTRWRRIGSGES